MNADIIKLLEGYGQSTVQQIRDNLASAGKNATGKTSTSLRYSVEDNGTKATLRIIGKPFFAVVETGRKPTPQYDKPSENFVQSIKDWMDAKGKTGSAYGLARHIHQKGTKLFRDGGRQDIYSNVINQNLVDKISLDLLNKFASQFMTNIVKMFTDGNNNITTA